MSEHPELREAPTATDLARLIGPVLKGLYPQNPDVVLGREARLIADALLAGPVGKLQAEIERLRERLAEAQRRLAGNRSIIKHDSFAGMCGNPNPHKPHSGALFDDILGWVPSRCSGLRAAGESTVTGEASG